MGPVKANFRSDPGYGGTIACVAGAMSSRREEEGLQ